MSIIDTLITDRTAADTAALEALFAKAKAGTITDEEWAVLTDPTHKGAYNYTDLNRVSEALEYLKAKLEGYGYLAKGYSRVKIPHTDGKRLPDGYTEVEYIESNGTQYIDTLVTHSSLSEVVLCADVAYDTVSPSNQIMGFSGSGGNGIGISKATWWEASSIASAVAGKKYSIEYGANGANIYRTVDGTTVAGTRTEYSFTTNMFLFAARASATSTSMAYYCSCKLYGAKIYVDSVLVRDYVPVKDANGNVGLYDLVEGKFYGNAGSGAFTGGAVVDPPVPSDPSDDETRDPFLWYEDDIPTANQMAQYITNVAVIRDTMEVLSTTPAAPGDMDRLIVEEANAIEMILTDVETLLTNMSHAFPHAGVTVCGIQGGLIA